MTAYDGLTVTLTERDAELLHLASKPDGTTEAMLNGTADCLPRLIEAGLVVNEHGWRACGRHGRAICLTRAGRLALRNAVLEGFTPPLPQKKSVRRLVSAPDIFGGMR